MTGRFAWVVLVATLVAIPVLGGLAVGGASATTAGPRATVSPGAAPSCPTPTNGGTWDSSNFFVSLQPQITVVGDPALSDSAFQIAPCSNTLPSDSPGIWLNFSTTVPILDANIALWATGWPTAGNQTVPVSGFSPVTPALFPMYVSPSQPNEASFFLNTFRYFWPGSEVYFNVTVNSSVGIPNSLRSANAYSNPYNYGGIVDNWTWMFTVASTWPTPTFGDDIDVSTTPSAIGSGTLYDPNAHQALDITLTSIGAGGGTPPPIGAAEVFFNLTGSTPGGPFNQYFTPSNRTVVNLTAPIGPYAGDTLHFRIVAWSLWSGGEVDPIWSSDYAINWTSQGGWWYPTRGLDANLVLSASPNVLTGTATLPTNDPVNVTVHSPLPNVTIASAAVAFVYHDAVGTLSGLLPMTAADANTSYSVLPGLPSGGAITFSVVAKDIFGTAVSSGNYSYSESGGPATSPLPGYGLVFIEAVDLSTGQLLPSLHFTIQNGSWSETAVGTPLGFATVVSPGGGSAPFPLAYGAYSVTISAYGNDPSGAIVVSSAGPTVLVFDVASSALPSNVWSAVPGLQAGEVGGLVAVAVAAPAIVLWFRERRAKAQAEQRRVTLG